MASDGRDRSRLLAWPAAALVLLLVLLAFVRYYPFAWDPPRFVQNDVVRTGEGWLRFGEQNRARTETTPTWVETARTDGMDVRLQVRPAADQTEPEASMMMLASDYWHLSFSLSQRGSDLFVWLQRPGASISGSPPFVVDSVLLPGRWTDVRMSVGAELRIIVDGRLRLAEALPPDALQGWGDGLVAMGDEIRGGVPWQGEIRRAEVRVGQESVDYAQDGALSIPTRYFSFPDHLAPSPPTTRLEWAILLAHLLSFVLLGFLLTVARRPPPRAMVTVPLAVGLALLLAAGKLLFNGRHLSAADLVVQGLGAALGVWLGGRFLRGRAETSGTAHHHGPEPASDGSETR